jgi:anti-sigma B factor antagonist
MMPESFSVRVERAGNVHRVIPSGELDLATAPILERELDALPPEAEVVVVVDLTELSFMDSTGLHLLLKLNHQLPERLRVINGSPAVERILNVSGVRSQLPIISHDADPLEPLQ